MKKRTIAIIGAGKVGTAIGYILKCGGYPVAGVASRTLKSAEQAVNFIGQGIPSTDLIETARAAEIIFITTPDKLIKETCDYIAEGGGIEKNNLVIHCSGAFSSLVLDSVHKKEAKAVSLHPLQSFADVNQAVNSLKRSYFCLEGDNSAFTEVRDIIGALGGIEINISSSNKVLYHAGAAVVSNYLVSIIHFGLKLYEVIGIPREKALSALLPLIKGTVNNIEEVGVPQALTGPIARGDWETVRDHLEALKKEAPQLVDIYSKLGEYTVQVGQEKGTLSKEDGEKLLKLFE